MPISPSFTLSQTVLTPQQITLADSSAGADDLVVDRQVSLKKADGTYITPAGTSGNFIDWPLTSPTLAIAGVDRDYALLITVNWLDGQGVVLYTTSTLYALTLNGELFLYELTQLQVATPLITQDKGYYLNKIKLRMSLDEAVNAVNFGGDILAAQAALDRAQNLMDHKNQYF